LQKLNHAIFAEKGVDADMLRLDKLHPEISGNKWFKLKYHLHKAKERSNNGIITTGGPYSNHLIATAAACAQQGLKSVAIVPARFDPHNHTLSRLRELEMHLVFCKRQELDDTIRKTQQEFPDYLYVPAGGESDDGVRGASEILQFDGASDYTHIICAAGTGTTVAGLATQLQPHQLLVAIPVLKFPDTVSNSIYNLINRYAPDKSVRLIWDYHFGGYARYTEELLEFMNDTYTVHEIPTDFVYTAKMLYAALDMVKKDQFLPGARLLLIHTGGLQGNRSLSAGSILFM
jgi:1-aminocyclopropane-1-carboxylate deaminase